MTVAPGLWAVAREHNLTSVYAAYTAHGDSYRFLVRYWMANFRGVGVVVVVDRHDWTAYIGTGDPMLDYDGILRVICDHGAKLRETDAVAILSADGGGIPDTEEGYRP